MHKREYEANVSNSFRNHPSGSSFQTDTLPLEASRDTKFFPLDRYNHSNLNEFNKRETAAGYFQPYSTNLKSDSFQTDADNLSECSRQQKPVGFQEPSLKVEPYCTEENKSSIALSSHSVPETAIETTLNSKENDDKMDYTNYREMEDKRVIAICTANPYNSLLAHQRNLIVSYIAKKILTLNPRKIKPQFSGPLFVRGVLRLICGNKPCVKFILSLTKELSRYAGTPLKIVEEPVEGRVAHAEAFFPRSQTESNHKILKYVQHQNIGIDTSSWKVLNRKQVSNKITKLFLRLDMDSARKVKYKGPLLNYKFGCCRFIVDAKEVRTGRPEGSGKFNFPDVAYFYFE